MQLFREENLPHKSRHLVSRATNREASFIRMVMKMLVFSLFLLFSASSIQAGCDCENKPNLLNVKGSIQEIDLKFALMEYEELKREVISTKRNIDRHSLSGEMSSQSDEIKAQVKALENHLDRLEQRVEAQRQKIIDEFSSPAPGQKK